MMRGIITALLIAAAVPIISQAGQVETVYLSESQVLTVRAKYNTPVTI